MSCSSQVLQAIIDHGAELNSTNNDNCTALMWVYKKRHVGAIHVLLKAESDTNIVDKNGNTCLMYALVRRCNLEILQAIIDHGADVNAINKQNITPLELASKTVNIDAIKLLLKAGANPIQFHITVELDWI